MRTTTAVRLGAAFTASALALSLGTSTALADDSTNTQVAHLKAIRPTAGVAQSAPVGSSAATSAKTSGKFSANAEALPTANIVSFGQKSVVLYAPGTFIYTATPNITNTDGISRVDTRLTVNGSGKGNREFGFKVIDGLYPVPGVVLTSSTTSVGKAKLGPSTITYNDGGTTPPSSDPTVGGNFYIRRGTDSFATYGLELIRTGSKIKFKANSWKVFIQSSGKWVGLRSIKLQQRNSNGSYTTIKTIPLNVYGSGSYTKTTSTRHRYRLLVPTTDTVFGSYTDTSGLI
jgi:hypothetical protein